MTLCHCFAFVYQVWFQSIWHNKRMRLLFLFLFDVLMVRAVIQTIRKYAVSHEYVEAVMEAPHNTEIAVFKANWVCDCEPMPRLNWDIKFTLSKQNTWMFQAKPSVRGIFAKSTHFITKTSITWHMKKGEIACAFH